MVADEVFVGRHDEQTRFAALLRGLAEAGGQRKSSWRRRRPPEDDGTTSARSPVVLVHGLGGSGKSTLLRHFRAMAAGRVPGSARPVGAMWAAWLDWEDEAGQDPGRYGGVSGPSLVTVLDAVQRTVIGAFADDERAAARVADGFADYRTGAARMPEYVARFQDLAGQADRPGSGFTSQDAAALVRAAVSAGLVAGGHPAGVLGLDPEKLAGAAVAGGHLSEAAVHAVTGRKPGELSAHEYDLVTDPARELTRRIATAIRAATGYGPLVMFLDTGEVIGDRAWGWLRRVMTLTGPRVAWVVGARFETEAEAGPDSPVARFVREIGDGQLMLMSPTRFDDAMIRAYLESRPAGPGFTDAQIDLVARFTRGLPLAVSFTAALLDGGQPVEEACREIDDGQPSTVISSLARRYLVHAEARETQDAYPPDDPRRGDVTKILALALAYGNLREDPDLLAALWDTTDPLATFQDLARRHDFVLPTSRRLHDDVRDTLRTDLLDPYRRQRARPVNQRALALFTGRLTSLRQRWPTLDEQLDHPEFTTALLGLLWHTTWISNQDGLDKFTAILPVLAAADPRTADAAAAITTQFAGTWTSDQEHQLDQLTEQRSVLFHVFGPPDDLMSPRGQAGTRRARITLDGLTVRQVGDQLLLGQPGDRQAAVHILRARLYTADKQDAAGVASLATAAGETTSSRLHQVTGTLAQAIADRLIWAGPDRAPVPTEIGLAAAKLATDLLADRATAWQAFAVELDHAGRYEEALAAHDQAVTLDPNMSYAHNNRGIALRALGRVEEALAAYDQALSLEPDNADNARVHSNRGNVLRALGRFEEALAAYDQALSLAPASGGVHENKGILLTVIGELGPALNELEAACRLDPQGVGEARTWAAAIHWHRRDASAARDQFAAVRGTVTGCTPFRTAEMEAIALCGLGHPDEARQHLLRAAPQLTSGDRADARTIYDLLADPPLPGIEDLRAIADS